MSATELGLSPVKVNDVTTRDGQQSLWATRMRINDVLKIVRKHAKAGFNALEVWGGATFDAAIRFKGENPWENLRQIKQAVLESAQEADIEAPPLMMLLRGQSLVGYKNYPDDVVRAFVRKAAENGMDIFRVFDGLNDMRNVAVAIDEVKKNGKHAQGTICYTTGPEIKPPPEGASKLGRQKIFNLEYFLGKARELKEMGCDSICLKDMAGLMEPEVAAELIPAIKKETGLAVVLHMHAGMGLSDATLMEAIRVGVDEIDVSNAGLASGSGHSSAQMIRNMCKRSDDPVFQQRMPKMDDAVLSDVRKDLLFMRPQYAKWETPYNPTVQEKIYRAQIPGGMFSNFESQIKEQIKGMKVIDKSVPSKEGEAPKLVPLTYDMAFDMILDEIPRVREELGYPPLVTPFSQLVGVQAVFNVLDVLHGKQRYHRMPEATRQLLLGEMGQTPVPPDAKLVEDAAQRSHRAPVTHRPADSLGKGLGAAREKMKARILNDSDEENVLTVALWDELGLTFLEKKHIPEPAPVTPVGYSIKGWGEGRKGFGDFADTIGPHMIEAIAQTAKELMRIEKGFFKHLPQEELDFRREAYREFIDRNITQMPTVLRRDGFNYLQAEWYTVAKGNQRQKSFNELIRERCVQLGVAAEFIPQVCPVKLAQTFEGKSAPPRKANGAHSPFVNDKDTWIRTPGVMGINPPANPSPAAYN